LVLLLRVRFDLTSKTTFVFLHGLSRRCSAHHPTKVRTPTELPNYCSPLAFIGKEAAWERVLLTFEKYAIDYKKKYGLVPVLIFDNCDSLANKDPKILEILQDTAKTAIDDSTWITVFITSVGHAPEQMEGEYRRPEAIRQS
jgi:hypothetical protein